MVVLAALLMMVPVAGASTIGTYDSSIQIQNLSDTTAANVVLDFYNTVGNGGGMETQVTDSIPAGESNTYYPLPSNVPAGFNGSVVVSSDQPVAAVANVVGDNLTFGSSYSGFSGGDMTSSLPVVMKGNYNIDTWFNVMNVGTINASVSVAYSGTACTEGPVNVGPGEAVTFDQAANSCLPAGHVGAATVTATGSPIVSTALEVGNNGLFAYNGFTAADGSVMPVVPFLSANNFGFHTGLQIQNQGAASTNVTVSYTPAGSGTACTETQTIPAGQQKTYALYAFSFTGGVGVTTNCTMGQKFVGSAAVTANSGTQNLVAIVNSTNLTKWGSAYNAFNPAAGTDTVVMPLIMDSHYGIFTGFNVMNVGNANTEVTCSFVGVSSTFDVVATLAPNAAMNHNQSGYLPDPTPGSAAGYVGSATCTTDNGQPIIAVVNQLNPGGAGDTSLAYEAFNN